VDPWTCAGCATNDRHDCIALLQYDLPTARYENQTADDESSVDTNDVGCDVAVKITRAQERVAVQADCSSDQALVLMREHARTTHHRVADIADAVLAHRIWFSA